MALPKDPFVSVSTWAGIWSFSARGKATQTDHQTYGNGQHPPVPGLATAPCPFLPPGADTEAAHHRKHHRKGIQQRGRVRKQIVIEGPDGKAQKACRPNIQPGVLRLHQSGGCIKQKQIAHQDIQAIAEKNQRKHCLPPGVVLYILLYMTPPGKQGAPRKNVVFSSEPPKSTP